MGSSYRFAVGGEIANKGEKEFEGYTKGSMLPKGMVCQIADVTTPLMAVHKMVENDHTVIFSKRGSYAQCDLTGDIMHFESRQGSYYLPVWVNQRGHSLASGFGGPGK